MAKKTFIILAFVGFFILAFTIFSLIWVVAGLSSNGIYSFNMYFPKDFITSLGSSIILEIGFIVTILRNKKEKGKF